MSNKLFSVITVVRNDCHNITKTAESVLSQEAGLFEYIIIDGDSTDGTKDIIECFRPQLAFYLSEQDHGIYNAMNKGLAEANGEYVIFLNSGDRFVDSTVLSKTASALQDISADVVYGDVMLGKSDGGDFVKKAQPPTNCHRMYFCHQSSFVRREVIQAMPFDEKYQMSADFKLMKQLFLQKNRFYHLDFPVAFFDRNGISNTQRAKGLSENIKIINECDSGMERVRLLLRIIPSYFFALLRS